jgi:Protein of unknown function (DUF2690)
METATDGEDRVKRSMLARSAGLLCAALTFMAVAPAPAAMAATCRDGTCYGKDPSASGCGADAVTLEARQIYSDDYYELRFSRTCYAVWARVKNGDYADLEAKQDGRLNFHLRAPNQAFTWISPMIGFSYSVRLCGTRVTAFGLSPRYCTNYR